MIVDTSAIVAIVLSEPESEAFEKAILAGDTVSMSAANHLELTITMARKGGPELLRAADATLEQLAIEILPVTVEDGRIAREAFLRFGRGFHPAALNYGDCFAYAAAKARGRPLLYKGDDFARTDIASASAVTR